MNTSSLAFLLPWYGCTFRVNETTGKRVTWLTRGNTTCGSPKCVEGDAGYGEILSRLWPNRTGGIDAPHWDETLGSAWFRYRTAAGATQEVWFDDPRATRLKAKFARQRGMRGIGVWTADATSFGDDLHPAAAQAMWAALTDKEPAALKSDDTRVTVPHLEGIFLALSASNANYTASQWSREFAAMRKVGITFAAVRAAIEGVSNSTEGGCSLGTFVTYYPATLTPAHCYTRVATSAGDSPLGRLLAAAAENGVKVHITPAFQSKGMFSWPHGGVYFQALGRLQAEVFDDVVAAFPEHRATTIAGVYTALEEWNSGGWMNLNESLALEYLQPLAAHVHANDSHLQVWASPNYNGNSTLHPQAQSPQAYAAYWERVWTLAPDFGFIAVQDARGYNGNTDAMVAADLKELRKSAQASGRELYSNVELFQGWPSGCTYPGPCGRHPAPIERVVKQIQNEAAIVDGRLVAWEWRSCLSPYTNDATAALFREYLKYLQRARGQAPPRRPEKLQALKTDETTEEKYLMLDRSFFVSRSDAELVLHRPRREPQPAITAEHPWERFIADAMVVDWGGGESRLYYTCTAADGPTAALPGYVKVCLAVSRSNGTAWYKPVLNVSTFNGSMATNIISINGGAESTQAQVGGVWRDSDAWKMLVTLCYIPRYCQPHDGQTFGGAKRLGDADRLGGGRGLFVASSSDGISWTTDFLVPSLVGSDTMNVGMGRDSSGNYTFFVRHHKNDSDAEHFAASRQIGLCSTADLADFGPIREVFKAAPVAGEVVDVYTSAATRYHSWWLFFPAFYRHFGLTPEPDRAPPFNGSNDGLVDIRFLHGGRAGAAPTTLQYVDTGLAGDGRAPWLPLNVNRCDFRGSIHQTDGWCDPRNPAGNIERTSFGTSVNFVSPGILEHGETLSQFVTASQVTHSSPWGLGTSAIERLTLRTDGFAALHGSPLELMPPGAKDFAEVVTEAVTVPKCAPSTEAEVRLNVVTSVAGFVAVELLGQDGRTPLAGYEMASSNPITGNFIARPASWGSDAHYTQAVPAETQGTSGLRLRIKLPGAQLYSITIACAS